MKAFLVYYETYGTPVSNPDYPSLNAGHDGIETGYMVIHAEDHAELNSHYDAEIHRVFREVGILPSPYAIVPEILKALETAISTIETLEMSRGRASDQLKANLKDILKKAKSK